MAEKEEKEKMRILLHGENKLKITESGFIMLKSLLTVFLVIICFAAVLGAMSVVSRQSSRLLDNAKKEITRQNEITLKRLNNETY